MRADLKPEQVVAEYRGSIRNMSASDVFFAATTASRSWRGAVIELEARSRVAAATYAYQLDWQSPADGGKWGACHGLDIPLVFGTLDAPDSLTGTAQMREPFRGGRRCVPRLRAGRRSESRRACPEWRPYRLEEARDDDVRPAVAAHERPRGGGTTPVRKVPFIQQGT